MLVLNVNFMYRKSLFSSSVLRHPDFEEESSYTGKPGENDITKVEETDLLLKLDMTLIFLEFEETIKNSKNQDSKATTSSKTQEPDIIKKAANQAKKKFQELMNGKIGGTSEEDIGYKRKTAIEKDPKIKKELETVNKEGEKTFDKALNSRITKHTLNQKHISEKKHDSEPKGNLGGVTKQETGKNRTLK